MANSNPFLESPLEDITAELTPIAPPARQKASAPSISAPVTTTRGSAPTRDDLIRRATELDVDPKLALAFFNQESSGNWNSPDSPRKAIGGMQVTPGTYKDMMGTSEGQRDPWNNMEAGLRYIRYGQDTLGTRDPRLLAAGYHAGYNRPELKRGEIPNTNDGMISTRDYADSIFARVSGQPIQKASATKQNAALDLTPITDPAEYRKYGMEPPANPLDLEPYDPESDAPKQRTFTQEYITDPLKLGWTGVKQGMQVNITDFNARQLAVIGKIDRGENVPEMEDPAGYKYMNAQQRADYKKQLGVAFNAGVQRVSELEKEASVIPQDPIVAQAQKAKSFDEWWSYFSQKPFKFLAQTGVQSLPAMAPGLVVGGVGGVVTRSAAVGAAGLGMGSYGVDYSASVIEGLKENGVNVADANSLSKAFSDPALMDKVRKSAASHATAVGTLDAISGGRAGATIVPGKGVVRQGANLAAKTVEQGALGAAGEAGGQIAQGKQFEAGPIMSEFVGEVAGAPAEIAGATYVAGKEKIQEMRQGGAQPAAPAPNTADLERIEPTLNAPSQARGPLERAAENAAAEPEKVTVNTPQGSVSGTVTGKAKDGTTQIVGDDGQVYTFKVGENGVTMTPEAPNTPLTNALDAAAGNAAATQPEAFNAPQQAAGEITAAPETVAPAADAAPAQDAPVTQGGGQSTAPAIKIEQTAPAQADLSTMDEPALRERLKYVAGQAKTNGGWNKMLMAERRRVESEINKRQKDAEQQAGGDKAKWLKALTDENTAAGDTGVQLIVNKDGGLIFYGDPAATKQGKRLMATFEEARKAGATEAEIAQSILDAKRMNMKGGVNVRDGKVSDTTQGSGAAVQPSAVPGEAPALPAGGREPGAANNDRNAGAADKPAALKTTSKPVDQLADDEWAGVIGAIEGPARPDAKHEQISSDDAVMLRKMVVKTIKDGVKAGKTREQIVAQIEALTKGGIGNAGMSRINDLLDAQPKTAKTDSGKPTNASKEDVEHLFGIDKKREKALERIAAGKAWFNDGVKAKDFIAKNGLKDTHEVVKGKGGRFEVQAKGQTDGNDNGAAGQRNGAEEVGKAAGQGSAPAAVQSDAGQAKAEREVRKKQLEDANDWWTGANRAERKTLIREKYTEAIADTNSRLEWNEIGEGMRERVADILAEKAAPEVGAPLPNATAPEQVRGVDDRELGEIVAEFNDAQKGMIEDGEKVTHVFDAPKKAEIVRLNDKVKVYVKDKGWMSPAEAKAEIAKWKEHAQAQGENDATRIANSQKVVLSLFDLSGEWSKPWEEAGYQVYRFDIQNDPEMGDVNNFSTEFFGDWFGDFDGMDIYAILAACPCTDFASSGARHFAAKDKDGRTVSSVKLVHQTLATIEYFKPAVWAIENPVGRIEDLGGLPPWRLSFDPNHLGDTYTKKTLLWGRFNGELPIAPVEPTEGSKMWSQYGGKSLATKNARSVTPEGFSYGFFMANNAADHPAMAVANKFDRLDRKIIERAIKAGVTPEQIESAVEDFYYMDLDDEAANRAILDLIDQQKAEPAAVDGEAWWKSLTPNARREAMDAAGVKLPDRVLWNYIKPAMQEKLLAVMNGQNDELDAEMRSYEAKADAKDFAGRVDKTLGKVRKFASGLSAIGDFTRASRASGGLDLTGVGVDVGELSKNAIDALANAAVNFRTSIFIDSGAFGAFRRGLKSGQFTPMDFDAILAKYDSIIEAIGKASEDAGEVNDYPRPMLVMPDVVGDQTASLNLIRKHADWIRAEVNANLSQPIIPIQKGEMSMAEAYREVVSILGSDNFIVGIPSNEEAVTPGELEQFLRDARPSAIHVLGAASDKKLRPRIESVVRSGVDGIKVTADASPIRNQVIRSVAKGAKRGDVIENLLLNQDDPALAKDRESIAEAGTITRRDGAPFATLEKAEQALSNRGLKKTHEAVAVDGGYVLQPKAEAAPEGSTDRYNALVAQWNDLVNRYKAGDEQDKAIIKPAMDLLKAEMDAMRRDSLMEGKRLAAKAGERERARIQSQYEAMPVGSRLRPSEFDAAKGIYWEKTGDNEWVGRGEWFQNGQTRTNAGLAESGGLVEMQASAPAVSPLTQARNDLIDLRTQVEAQGNVVDDRLLERVRRQEKLVKELEAEQSKPAMSAQEAARYLKDFVYSLDQLDGVSDRVQVELPLGKSGRDSLLMKAFGLTREQAHEINNRLDASKPRKLRQIDMQEAFDIFPGLREMIDSAIAAEAERAAKKASKPAVTENKVFTEDAAAKARALLKKRLSGSQLNSGVDPEFLQAGITLAGYHIEKGARTFAAYAQAMIADLGDVVKPYLKSWYMGVKYDPRAAAFDGMDTAAQVEAADVDAMTAALAGENANEPETLDQPGTGALEGAPADLLSGIEPDGQAGRGAEGSGRGNAPRNERTRGSRVQQSGGMGDGAGDVSVPAERTRKGRGGQPGSATVPGGKRAAKSDPTIDAGGNDLLTPTEGQRAQDRASDFQIKESDEIGEGGAKTKFRNNMAAIRLLKQLQAENRAATRDEQAVLAKYVGWGGLPQAFFRDNGEVTKGWEKEAAELKDTLTEQELAAAASSTRNAHYTSPEIVKGMWEAVKHFGFQGGRVLEPSVGVGNFFGLMPKDLRSTSALNGVELDHITGGIAQKLYPQANVAAPVGFQDYSAPDNYFDLAIGNPPFGREGIYDATRRKISGFSIHNYFFAKSIDTVKPNGVLAMVVTNRLLDSAGDKARQYIADRAEFLGAIRLPNNAFLKNAGTEVTTDIIFLRKLKDGEQPTGQSWMNVRTFTDKAGKDVPLNEYFVRNPDMMLGEFGAYGSMYSPDEPALVARDGQDTAALLAEAIKKLPANFMDAPTAEPTRETITPIRDISDVKVGSVFEQNGEVYERREDLLNQQQAAPITFASDKARERVLGMIGVRDALVKVRALQLSDRATETQIEAARAELNKVYDAFVKANGPINVDANKRLMRDDPSWPQIAALEDNFDKGISPAVAKSTGEAPRAPSARKAAIFSKRTQSPYQPPQKANSAKDALVTSLAERGRVDLDYMAGLYGKTPEAIAKELGDLIYRNPVGGWETREQYLSGNVKKKLAEAIAAAKTDPAMNANVDALRAVQPADIEAVDIDVKVGAQWIPADVMEDFVRAVTEAGRTKALYNPVNAQWTLTADNMPASAQTQWGTDRVRAIGVLEAAANQKQIQVFDNHPDGSRTLNERETTAANEKAERVKAEWRRWIWEDDARRERLARIYNDTFNTDVQRDYDGSHLTFPGKVGNDIISLRPHQANAIWRIVQSGTTLLDHVVGAGKTFTMIGGIMELRRMGLAKKPMLVVPNHLVGQWAEDFMKLYPGANILAATKRDFEKDNRKKLFARIATGDWDAVIVAHSSFGKVEVEPEFQEAFIKQQISDMDTSISAMRAAEGKGSRNVKQIEKQKAALEEKLKRLFDTGSKDDNLYFGELGVDAVFVDEAHEFKNLGFSTSMQRVAGLGNPTGSNKAADLFMKVRSILKRTNGRNVVFATGTPISNTMAEMYTMQRYLDYETLQAQGIAHFDAWAKTFGEVVTDWELSPSGQYKMNSRFAKFVNMPELMQRYQSFGDVINRDDINRQLAAQGKKLPVPKVKGGKPENVIVPRSDDQAQYIGVPMTYDDGREVYPEGSLIWRSENLPKKAEKGADNMLKIMSDARKAALDMRLIDPSYPDNPGSKVNVAADNIKTIYDQWSKDKGAQLVFIDLSTPKGAVAKEAARIQELMNAAEQGDEAAQEKLDAMSPDELMALESGKFSVYDDLKDKLIARGIPEKEIAFIHDANTEQQKEDLFGKVRSGRIRVLFGSTAKMGAGMNVQERLVALHHLDAPWRPSDLEQREGRIIRQGNKLYEADPENFEVQIQRYATKQTLDSRMWQTIEAKARFIEQVRKGAGSREVEDVAGEAANSAEMKAASSGNPLILEEMTLRQAIRKLENQQAEHAREQHRIRDRMRMLADSAARTDARAALAEQDAKKVPAKFAVQVGNQTFEKHGEAGEAILAAVEAMQKAGEDTRDIGSYGGFALSLAEVGRMGGQNEVLLIVKGADEYQIEANPGSNATGLGLRLQNTVKGLADDAKGARATAEKNRADIPKLEAQIKPWGQDQELADMKARHAAIIEQLRPKKNQAAADLPVADANALILSAQEYEQRFGMKPNFKDGYVVASAGGGGYANLPKKPFATRSEAQAWIDRQTSEKPAFSRRNDRAELEAIFEGLEGRGKARREAASAAEKRFDSDTIAYVDQNFWDILAELEDSGKVDINC